jgi:hypothetical protein
VVLLASGDVSDYDETARAQLATRFANTAGVDAGVVSVTITAASVRIHVSITVASDEEARALNVTLTRQLGTTQLATEFLADFALAGGAAIQVERVERVGIANAPPSNQGALITHDASGGPVWPWVVLGVGVALLFGLLSVVLACARRRRKAKHSSNVTVTRDVEVSSISHATTSVPVDLYISSTENPNAAVSPSKAYESRLHRARMARSKSSEQLASPTVEAASKAPDSTGDTVSRV